MRVSWCSVLVATLALAGTAFGATNGDKYCTDKNSTTFLVRHAGNDLEFSLSSWSGRGHFFGMSGTAHPDASGWLYQEHMDSPKLEARCEAHIVPQPAGGYTFWLTPAGPCSEEQGGSYQPNSRVLFPANARRGGIPSNKTMEQAASPEAGGEWCR
jgi:hypothetical protein